MYKKTRRLSIEHARIARKASFWQPKYDEWKKYGVKCPNFSLSKIMSDDLLQGYMDKGWDKITEIYKKNLTNKSKNISPKAKILYDFETKPIEEEELIISILGSIRKFIIKSTFKSITKSINNNNNEILTVGSNNITSDFDVTILGPNANTIMWKMFISFLAKFEDSLPEAFDSNLYCSPLYIYENINHDNIVCKSKNKLPQRIDYKYRNFTLVPFTDEDLITELNWACVKLLDLNLSNYESLTKYIKNAKKYKLILDKISNDADNDNNFKDISLQNNLHPSNKFNKETIDTIKNYYLQWKYQKPIQKFIYSNDNENLNFYDELITLPGNDKPETNIFFYSNIPNYFSSDAYYTSSSVNSVVINTQMNIQFNINNRSEKIKNGIYIISAIENFGDMIRKLKKASYELELNNKNLENKMSLDNQQSIKIPNYFIKEDSTEKKFKCDKCNLSFNKYFSLQNHKNQFHKNKKELKTNIDIQNEINNDNDNDNEINNNHENKINNNHENKINNNEINNNQNEINTEYEDELKFEKNKKINIIKTIVIKNSKYLFRIFNDLIKAGDLDLIKINKK